MSTGLYRVYEQKGYNGATIWSYRVNNKIIKKEINRKDLALVKALVEEAGLLWGITNIKDATETAKKTGIKLKDLQGRYGEQINE